MNPPRQLLLTAAAALCCTLISSVAIWAGADPAPGGVEYDQSADAGPHHRIQRVTEVANELGRVTQRERAYTVVASGLNYLDKGRWVESKEAIEIQPDGSAAAVQSQHKVRFSASAQDPAGTVNLLTPEGYQIRTAFVGLAYYDASTGQSVLLSEIKDSPGEIQPPARIVYWDALTDLKGALVYTVSRSGLEQDVILEECPPDPKVFGLSPDSTRLEVWTEVFTTQKPKAITQTLRQETDSTKRATMADPDFEDQTLDFGAMRMIQGRAFTLPEREPKEGLGENPDRAPIGKRWVEDQGRSFIVEAVEYLAIKSKLKDLPSATAMKSSGRAGYEICMGRKLPEPAKARPMGSAVVTVAKETQPLQGLVLDYLIQSGVSCDNFTFLTGTTYFIDGTIYIWNSTTIQSGTCIKYIESNSSYYCLDLYGSVSTPSSSPAATFTSKNDNSAGETIVGSSGNPAPGGMTKICMHNLSGYFVENLAIKYAMQGVHMANSSYNSYVFRNSRFEHCFTGVGVYGCLVTFDNDYYCVGSSLYDTYGGSGWVVDHTTPADCGVVQSPCFIPSGMGFETSVDVTMTTSTPGATIYYTVDGSPPTTSSTPYSAPVHLTATTTLTAKAVRTNWEDSATTIAVYMKAPPLAEALDAPQFTWSTGGDNYWVGIPYCYYGTSSVCTKPLGDNQSAWLQTQVIGPGRVEFYWKVSSEPLFDILWFSVDGIDRFGTSGENGWYWNYYDVTGTGLHTLRWTYRKNASGRSGGDCAYVDYFRFTANDSDNDGLLDSWEMAYFGSLGQAASGDWDGDGKSNLEEYQAGTDPTVTSTLQVFSPLK